MSVPLLDLAAQYAPIAEDVLEAVSKVFASQRFIGGPRLEAFESQLAEYCGCEHGLALSSGTDALLVALMAESIGPGDEVITTPFSFIATAEVIDRVGATPVFVDIDPVSFNIDPAGIEAAITEHTKAIMPVHLFGQIAEMGPILELAQAHSLAVIEDAAQAIGAAEDGQRAGSFGHWGAFSFFPSKNLGAAGDAGGLVTNDQERFERARLIRTHGTISTYEHQILGGNFRMDAIQAAVLEVKLPFLDSWTDSRRANAEDYRKRFAQAGLSGPGGPIRPPLEAAGKRHIYNQFSLLANNRDELLKHLRGRGIGSAVYYPIPFHLQPCFAGLGYSPGAFPVAEKAASEVISIPIYSELSEDQRAEVVTAIADFYA